MTSSSSSYILEMTTYHSDMIRILFEALKDILTDINIIFSPNGMKIAAFDGTRTSLVHVFLEADKIRQDGNYKCNTSFAIGVSMVNLFKLIKTVTKDDIISFFVKENNQNKLNIRIENASKNYVNKFELQLLDIDLEDIKLPTIDFPIVITIPSQDFQKYCRDMFNLSDTLEIKYINNQLILQCMGDFASQEIIIGEATNNNNIIEENLDTDIIQGKYSLKFLTLFTKATNLCSSIRMFIDNDEPLILEYSIANLGRIKFLLAQKIM